MISANIFERWLGWLLLRRVRKLWLGTIAITFAAATDSQADQINLETGDRISGTFVEFEEDRLAFDTDFAGRLSVARRNIISLSTDEVVTVVFKDNYRVSGKIDAGQLGEMRIVDGAPDPNATFTLDGVEAIYLGRNNVPPAFRWGGRINIAFSRETGNTEKDVARLDGQITGRSKRARLSARADTKFEENPFIGVTENKAIGTLGFDRFVTDRAFFYLSAGFEFDEFKDLNIRSVTSAGPGLQFYEGEDRNLAIRVGPAYLYESFRGGTRETRAPALSWAFEIDQFLFGRFVQAFHLQTAVWNLEQTSSAVYLASSGLRFPIRGGFWATLRFDIQHETEPSFGREKTDRTYRTSLGYEW